MIPTMLDKLVVVGVVLIALQAATLFALLCIFATLRNQRY